MKVTCNHCGVKNELGRIFCMSCGKKMHITNEDVDQAVVEKRAFDVLALVRTLVLLVIVALFLVALWPQKAMVSALDNAKKAQVRNRMGAKLTTLINAARGKRSASVLFNADELDVYLASRAGGATTNRPALSVRLEGTRMIVLQQAFAGPFKVGGKTVGPLRYTRALTCEAAGKSLKVKGGSFGHLPLPGPLANMIVAPVASAFVLTPAEQAIEKQVKEMTILDGELEIVVGP